MHRAATEKLDKEFYSSDIWKNYLIMRFDMLAMCLKSENKSCRRSFKSLTCSMCGKVKGVGVKGFADVRFSHEIGDRKCNPCFGTICDLDGDDLAARKLMYEELHKIMAKTLERGRGWSCLLRLL